MSIHQTSKTRKWYVKWLDPKTGQQRSKWFGKGEEGSAAHKGAIDFDNELKALRQLGKKLPTSGNPKGISMQELVEAYVGHHRTSGKNTKWLRDWVSVLENHIIPLLNDTPVNKLEYSDMVRIVDHYSKRRVTPATINRYLSYLKAMFRFGIKLQIIENNPLEHWQKRKELPKKSLLTLVDLRKIQKHSPDHLAWAIEVAFNLVVRVGRSELTAITWDRVDWSKKGVWVFMPKTNREKFVPCTDAFMVKLAERESKARSRHIVEYRGKPIGCIRVGWNLAVKRANIPYHTTPYDIRHLAITELLTRGVDPGAVADIAGHANPFFTITRYHHVREGAKRQAIDQLPSL